MKHHNTMATVLLAACFLTANAPRTMAISPVAGDDFDGGTTNGGLTPLTQVFTPDNSSTVGKERGMWTGGSFFDRFGIVSRSDALPYDFTDDSAGTFPPDSMGILKLGKLDNVVVLADTVNTQNPGGLVKTEWTFDISGKTGLQLSVDLAMVGDFDLTDDFLFTYSIDGGTSQTAYDIQVDEVVDPIFGPTDSGIFYGVEMESATFYDRYFTPFFEETLWDQLLLLGEPYGTINWHPDDNGMDGDTVAQDGYIPVDSLGGVIDERAYLDDSYEEVEKLAYKDPLFVNGDADTGIQLTNVFQKITVPIVGTGTELALSFAGTTNSGQEFFAFDNILIEDGAAVDNADFDGDNDVDGNDFLIWQRGNGLTGQVDNSTGDADGNGTVNGLDLAIWNGQFGQASAEATISSVPEPSALVLLGLSGLAWLWRRR